LAFQSFDIKLTWWRLFQKPAVCTTFDNYVFIQQDCVCFTLIYIMLGYHGVTLVHVRIYRELKCQAHFIFANDRWLSDENSVNASILLNSKIMYCIVQQTRLCGILYLTWALGSGLQIRISSEVEISFVTKHKFTCMVRTKRC
jgi:hypothetical protein